jgi:hypothetical protein
VTDTSPAKAPTRANRGRGQRILASLVAGAGLDEVGSIEKISRKRVEKILRDELHRRWVAPAQDFARIQIARLDNMVVQLIGRAQRGDLGAIDRILKILDRLDRYHGFTRATQATVETYGPEERERLMNKINAVAARLQADDAKE